MMFETILKAIAPITHPDYTNAGMEQLMREVQGMSAMRNLAILQACVGVYKPTCSYLEIGSFKGLSARAAMLGNPHATYVCVDNFSEQGIHGSYREECIANLQAGENNGNLYEQDGIQWLAGFGGTKFNVFYYDGKHDCQSTYTALALARYHLAPGGTCIIDDTNSGYVRGAVLHACRDFGYRMVYDIWTPHNGSPDYWNGIMVITK